MGKEAQHGETVSPPRVMSNSPLPMLDPHPKVPEHGSPRRVGPVILVGVGAVAIVMATVFITRALDGRKDAAGQVSAITAAETETCRAADIFVNIDNEVSSTFGEISEVQRLAAVAALSGNEDMSAAGEVLANSQRAQRIRERNWEAADIAILRIVRLCSKMGHQRTWRG